MFWRLAQKCSRSAILSLSGLLSRKSNLKILTRFNQESVTSYFLRPKYNHKMFKKGRFGLKTSEVGVLRPWKGRGNAFSPFLVKKGKVPNFWETFGKVPKTHVNPPPPAIASLIGTQESDLFWCKITFHLVYHYLL